MSTIAFLGLGVMGERMARNLVKAGHTVTVYNRTASKAEALVAEGAQMATTSHEAVRNAEVIISIVANDAASQAIWLGEEGAIAGATEGAIALECSTLSPTWVAELAHLTTNRGLTFVDAPVMGSTDAAAGAMLKFLMGGHTETIEHLRPVLLSMGNEIFHCGATGSGTAMKLVYNTMLAIQMAALGEVVGLAERAGLDAALATRVLSTGGTASPLIQRSSASVVARDYGNPGFQLQHMRKDVTYALQMAQTVGAALPIAAVTRELYQLAGAKGYDTLGMAAVGEVVRESKKEL